MPPTAAARISLVECPRLDQVHGETSRAQLIRRTIRDGGKAAK